MDRYVIIDGPRILKLSDGVAVAELTAGLWVPARPVEQKVLSLAVNLSERDLVDVTSIPGSVVTRENIRWLWEFTCAAVTMCTWEYDRCLAYFAELEERFEEGSKDGWLTDDAFGNIWIECQAAAYIVLRNKTMKSGYMRFDEEAGTLFLDYYAFPFYAKASFTKKRGTGEFKEKIRHLAMEYDKAAVDKSRPLFPQAPWTWEKWKGTPSNWYTRIGFCLCSRVFLRAQGLPEEKMDYDEEAMAIFIFNFSDCTPYIAFTLDFVEQWVKWACKFGAELPLYDQSRSA